MYLSVGDQIKHRGSFTIQVMHAAPHGAAFGIVSSVYCGMVLLLSHI